MLLDKILELNLTEVQETRLKEIFDSYRPKQRNLAVKLDAAQQQLRSAIEAEPTSEQQLRQAFQQVSKVKEDLLVDRTRMMSRVRSVLNQTQLDQIRKWRGEAKRSKRRHGMF